MKFPESIQKLIWRLFNYEIKITQFPFNARPGGKDCARALKWAWFATKFFNIPKIIIPKGVFYLGKSGK